MTELSDMPGQEMTLRDYVRVLFRHKLVIFLSFFIVMSIVTAGLMFRTPTYQASVKMLVSAQKQVDAPYYKELLSAQQMQESLTQSEIVTSDPVLQRVVYALRLYQKPADYEMQFASPLKRKWIKLQTKMYRSKLESLPTQEQNLYNFRRAVEELHSSIKVEPVRDTNLFTITVKDFDRIGAAITANVVSRSYVIFDLEQQMAELQMKYGAKHPVVMQLLDNIKRMKEGLNGKPLPNADAIGTASVKIIEQASVPLKPVGQNGKLIFIAAFFASIFLGIILAFLFEYMDQSIKSTRDLENSLKIPFLGGMPYARQKRNMIVKGVLNRWTSRRYINAIKSLTDQIHLLMTTKSFKTIYIATSDTRDGESAIIAHLGYQLADHAVKKVLILDANFRHGALPKIFRMTTGPGLVDVVTAQASLSEAVQTLTPRLSFLPAGKTKLNPVTFLDSAKMREVVGELKNQYDLILVCCAELKSYRDGYLLAALLDETVIVVTENETRRQVASLEVAALKERKVSLLGAILKNRTYPIPRFIYNRI